MSYRRLIELRPEVGRGLRKLSPDLHLWQLEQQSQAYRDAVELRSLLTGIAGIGPTRASMLMARKRPKLVPIEDRWKRQFFGDVDDFSIRLAQVMRDMDLRQALESLRPPGLDTSGLSLLRVLDIAIWMALGRAAPSVHDDNGDVG